MLDDRSCTLRQRERELAYSAARTDTMASLAQMLAPVLVGNTVENNLHTYGDSYGGAGMASSDVWLPEGAMVLNNIIPAQQRQAVNEGGAICDG